MTQYRVLHSLDDLEPLLSADGGRAILFKHSLTCPISSRALREYEAFLGDADATAGIDCTLIEVQNTREISNAIAERTDVRHESPQALVVDAGEVIWHASHGRITADSLRDATR